MDAIELLTKDHERLRALFRKADESKGAEQERAFKELAELLTLHSKQEEELFYPELRKQEETREMVGESLEEHLQADILLAEMKRIEVGSETWKSKLTVLREDIEHHAGEEEEELFPQARKLCKAGWLDEMGKKMEQQRAAAAKR